MFDWLVQIFTEYPYLGVAGVLVLCSVGLPLPEELVLIAGGYVCFRGWAEWYVMAAASGATIMAGDLLPFFLGRTFGTRLLRLKPLRFFVTRRRLKQFDRWFRRRGDLVIFIARFVAGLRVVAYFTAGTMRMSYPRFILLDLLGIALVVPTFIYVGFRFGHIIDTAIEQVQRVERGILIAVVVAAALAVLWIWLRRYRENRRSRGTRSETYVSPSVPPVGVAPPSPAEPTAGPRQAEAAPLPEPISPESPSGEAVAEAEGPRPGHDIES